MARPLEVKIYSARDDAGRYNDDFRFIGTYAHGELEDKIGYDVFSFDRKLNLEEGIHPMIVNNVAAVFMLWKAKKYVKFAEWRGFLVYNRDKDFDWCMDRFNSRQEVL